MRQRAFTMYGLFIFHEFRVAEHCRRIVAAGAWLRIALLLQMLSPCGGNPFARLCESLCEKIQKIGIQKSSNLKGDPGMFSDFFCSFIKQEVYRFTKVELCFPARTTTDVMKTVPLGDCDTTTTLTLSPPPPLRISMDLLPFHSKQRHASLLG